jgi:4-carboxymuconolactone decarboxylase
MGDFEAGMNVRRQVLGDAHVDRSIAATTELTRDFQQWITENVWGDLWTNPTFDLHTRSLLTIAILAALGREELALHLKASLNTGVTDTELAQVLQHVAIYAGVPAANHAFSTAATARPPADSTVHRATPAPTSTPVESATARPKES